MHLAFKRATLKLNNLPTLFVFLAFAWTVVIYTLHPIGFAMFGSASVGFRDYQRIILGVCSFVVLSNQHIGEKEARWVILITIGSAILGLAWSFFYGGILGRAGDGAVNEEGNQYTWHQSLAGPAFVFVLWMFCKYKNSQIFTIAHPTRVPFFLFCVFVAMQSGKRAMLGTIFLIPLFAAALRKEWAHFFVYTCGAVLAIALLVVGHGNLFDLPFRVQRSMANLPGNWDPDIKAISEEGGDGFRSVMRELAWEKVKRNPIVGTGIGFAAEDVAGINVSNYAQNIHQVLAVGSSWHNTWLGLWADFGLPAVIFHALIVLSYLAVAIRIFKETDRKTNLGVYSMMILIGLFFAILRSYTSGSSNVAFYFYWHFAIAVAILETLRASRQINRASVSTSEKPEFDPQIPSPVGQGSSRG